LEDFHKISEAEKLRLAQTMKVFMDMADQYRSVKVIAIGAVGTAREVVQADPEMRNRVAEIHVPLMTGEEVLRIITKGEQCLNVVFPENVKAGIVHHSNGVASVCHHICLNMCVAAGIEEACPTPVRFTSNHMRVGLGTYLDEASDTLKHTFDRAFKRKKKGKFDNCRLILEALTKCSQEGATHGEILGAIGRSDYPSGNLTFYLRELQTPSRGAVIRFDSVSGKFSFTDPIYRAFCGVYFDRTQAGQESERKLTAEVSEEQLQATIAEMLQRLQESLSTFSALKHDTEHWLAMPELPLADDISSEGKQSDS
jgi:hypothetical protein